MSDSYWKKNEEMLEQDLGEKAPWWSSRPVLIIFLAVVSVVILSLLWHALLPNKPQGNVEVPYIKAENAPVKVQPENPGGADIPHKDKMVYDLISDSGRKEGAESLQPAPEKPLYDTKFENPSELSERKDKVTVEDIKPVTGEESTLEDPVEQPVALEEKDVKEVVVDKKGAKKKVVSIEEKSKATPKAVGKHRVQVAALASSKAAEGEIKVLKRKYPSMKNVSLNVVKATVKGKTVYRIQTGGFQTRDQALSLCKKIKGEGGQCMLAS
jgi:hypothetical protein